jgi:hypothetical protein
VSQPSLSQGSPGSRPSSARSCSTGSGGARC